MEAADGLLVAMALGAIAALMWVLHRVLKYGQKRGWIRSDDESTGPPLLGGMSPLDEAVNPSVKHVHRVQEHRQHKRERDGEGDDADSTQT